MRFDEELEVLLRSRFTLICVVSVEEERLLAELRALCERTRRQLVVWDHADFFQPTAGGDALPPAKDPLAVLDAVDRHQGDALFVLRDFHQCWANQPRVVRKLRNVSQSLKFTRKSIVVTAPVVQVPEELRDVCVLLECPPPGVAELEAILDQLAATPGVRVDLGPASRDRLIRSALGLSSNQAQRVFARAMVTHGVLDERDIELVTAEKKEIIRGSGALEFFAPTETPADVGGLEVLKGWLGQRERALSREAREYGLPAPKGIALIGIPGTGKSLTAKMVASLWRLPLIRLDIGALFGSLVGQSEENTRRALRLAETVAPCVLWVDEIEKGLAVGPGDSGTSMRVLGSILSWMQERTQPVFMVATANDIAALPPELLRRGRFDEVFFLDLPTASERAEIFAVHLRKRRRPPERFDLPRLAAAAAGSVGAEIEQAIVDAMFAAFNDPAAPGREVTTADVLAAVARQVPMSRSQREVIAALRQWLAEGRAQSASFAEARQAAQQFVPIDLDPDPR